MKRVISLLLSIAIVISSLPMGSTKVFAADPKDDATNLNITGMQVNTEIERKKVGGQNTLVKEEFVDIRGGAFISDSFTIKKVHISKRNDDESLQTYIGVESFKVVDNGRIRVKLKSDTSIETGGKYLIEIEYSYKEGNIDKTGIKPSDIKNLFYIERKPMIAEEPDKTDIFLNDEITIVGTGLKEATMKLKNDATLSKAIELSGKSNDNKIVGKLEEDKNIATGLNDIVIESKQKVGGLPAATVTFKNALNVYLETTNIEVANITPTAGPMKGGTEVRITGKGLRDTSKVKFGDENATILRLEDIKDSEEKVLVVSSPKVDVAGTVTITIGGKEVGTFTYVTAGEELLLTGISPKVGNQLGGDIVNIEGFNFQLTKTDGTGESRKSISDEGSAKAEESNTKLIFEKDVSGEAIGFKRPTENVETRKREMKVTVGGRVATYVLEPGTATGDKTEDLNKLTQIDPRTGEQLIKISTPSIGAVQEDTTVKLEVQIITKFYDSDGKEIEEHQIIERQSLDFTYETIKKPDVKKITPTLGATSPITEVKSPNERHVDDANYPTIAIKGEKFLVQSKVGDDNKRRIEKPKVFVVPREELDDVVKAKVNDDNYKYKAKVKEVSIDENDDTVDADGVFIKLATKIVAELPAYPHSEEGPKDIVIINPDGGYTRLEDAFIYKKPNTNPKILEIKPMNVSARGGEKITIEAINIDGLAEDIIVTVDGELAKVEKLIREIKDEENRVFITIIAPKGKAGLKTVQVINKDGGTATSDISETETPEGQPNRKLYYKRVTSSPKITLIAPNYGGEGAKVIIKGSGFVRAEKDADGKEILNSGTRVWFGSHEIIEGVSYEDDEDSIKAEITIVDTNTIELTLPSGLGLGFKDVTVENPDSAKDTVKNGYNYLSPGTKPSITDIDPNYGTINGGTLVRITGEDFTKTVEVYFGEKKGLRPIVNADGTEIIVETPVYPINTANIDKVEVSLTVVNYDGGSVTKDRGNGFEYRVPGSFPAIENIDPKVGTTAGNTTVVITGKDFRLKKAPGNTQKNKYELGDEQPKVYFGGEEAKEVRYAGNSQLIVVTPVYQRPGKVDVVIVNPDAGTAISKGGFTYEVSKPTISTITPNVVHKDGGTDITVKGAGFLSGSFKNKIPENLPIDLEVILGNENASTTVIGGYGKVNVGEIEVEYDMQNPGNPIIKVKSRLETKEFKGKIDFANPLIVALKTSKDSEEPEGIKVSLEGNKLVVTRRLATNVKWIDENTLNIITPPMDGVGSRAITIKNRDGGEAKGTITIKKPDSKPRITDIVPKDENRDAAGDLDFYSVESTQEGNITFTIRGEDFRTGVKVLIGDQEATVLSKGPNDDHLVVRSPKAKPGDIGKKLKILVINDDGGFVDSSDPEKTKIGVGEKQAYYIYKEADSSPKVTTIEPNVGSIKGGDRVVIKGNDFRIGQENDLGVTVKFGGKEASVLVKESKYDTLVVITPPGDFPGLVDVHIKNTKVLGEIIVKDGFTYISAPTITRVTPYRVKRDGGHKVTIKGTGFLEGAKVSIGKGTEDIQPKEVKFIDSETIEILTPEIAMDRKEYEIPKDITITNPDGGKVTQTDGIIFTHSVPETPSNFEAIPGYERSMTLNWDKVEGAHRYKIFAKLYSDRSDKYEYLGETSNLSYIVKDLEADTRYSFRLWAVNEYGESKSEAETNARTLKRKDDKGDSKYDKDTESRASTEVLYTSGQITVNLADKYSYSNYNVNFTDAKYKDYSNIRVVIPALAINSGWGNAVIKTQDMLLDIPLGIFRPGMASGKDRNIIVELKRLTPQEKGHITKGLGRGEKAITDGYEIKYLLQDGRQISEIDALGAMGITSYLKSETSGNIYNARYEPSTNRLLKENGNVYLNSIRTDIYKSGKYITIEKR